MLTNDVNYSQTCSKRCLVPKASLFRAVNAFRVTWFERRSRAFASGTSPKCIDREGLGKTLYRDKAILSGYTWGMAYWPLTLYYRLTNLKVIQENEDGERAKYLSQEKLSSKCLYLFSYQKKGSKRPLIKAMNSVSVVCYILSNWPFNRGNNNEKMGLRKSWPRSLSTVELCLTTTPRGRVYGVPLYKSVLH